MAASEKKASLDGGKAGTNTSGSINLRHEE